MTLLFIQLAQSVTGAVVTIVALLLVSALIGYFTAWYYAKSVYTPVIKGLEADKKGLEADKKGLEADKAALIVQVAGLKDDLVKLNGKVEVLNDQIGKLEAGLAEKDKEIKQLRVTIK